MFRFLTGIGIPLLGQEAAKKIHQYFYGSMEKFEDAINENFFFSHIEGVSEALNSAIYKWYENPVNQNTLHALMAELDFSGDKNHLNTNSNPFLDKVVVLTGTFENLSLSRSSLIALLESLGAIVENRVTSECDYVIFGSLPGSKKVAAAMEYGITMIGEATFIKMLEQNR